MLIVNRKAKKKGFHKTKLKEEEEEVAIFRFFLPSFLSPSLSLTLSALPPFPHRRLGRHLHTQTHKEGEGERERGEMATMEMLGFVWLVGYIVMNLATTVLNKAILLVRTIR